MSLTNKSHAQAPEAEVEKVKASAEAAGTPVDESIIGSKSDKIEFIAPLGDPSRDDITSTPDPKGGKPITDRTPTIVGYQFRVLEDMDVPECGTSDDLKVNPMSYSDPNGKRHAKAGEVINLTRFETGMLLSPIEFNGRATGGQRPVSAAYQINTPKTAAGDIAKASDATKIPTVSLRAVEGSIKDYPMVNVLTFTTETTPEGRTRKNRTIVKGFEKWEPLCKVTVRKSSAGASAPKTVRNKGAETFLKIVAAKKA